ncbi:MAG: ROK family protein [Candidatus Woesearchaeota archaeon]
MRIAIDIGGTKIAAGVIQKKTLLTVIEQPTQTNIAKQIQTLIEQLNPKQKKITRISIAYPSPIVNKKLDFAKNLKKQDAQLVKKLQKIAPVFIQNDVNCVAVGLQTLQKTPKDFAVINIGTGLGCAIVINKKLLNGHTGYAGEIGNLPYKESILENYVSGHYFETHTKKQLREFSHHLAYCITLLSLAIDTPVIYLHGSVTQAYKLCKSDVQKELQKINSFRKKLPQIKIITKNHIALIGADSL